MFDDLQISFGDNVRVRPTLLTEQLGLAGMLGQVYGETTPSVTGVEVIGEVTKDCAVNVFFKERGEGYWFAPELIEFVDHAPGTEISLEGIPKKWVRTEAGEWVESETGDSTHTSKSWWKFW